MIRKSMQAMRIKLCQKCLENNVDSYYRYNEAIYAFVL